MYTDDALARRAALKFNSRVQAAIMRFFSVYKKDRKGRVLKVSTLPLTLGVGTTPVPCAPVGVPCRGWASPVLFGGPR
jgi:hypothetical protein